ncbi:MAG TPA: GIY-YIG nuclease family protein [Stellaceae bacterium]|nr:GIY-YIG nuclease family protein [Stellaceae bacterium]
MLKFNTLLAAEGIDPKFVRLARHQDTRVRGRTVYRLWRDDPAAFELYQRIQRRDVFPVGHMIAGFVGAPDGETLFVGLYAVTDREKAPPGTHDPLSGKDRSGYPFYTIERDACLAEFVGRLTIDWGKGRNWVQRASHQNKQVLEIRRELHDEPFPGFREFRCDIDEIESVPTAWREVLRSVKGVYLLVRKETGKQYVGSAKGDDSLWGRFIDYATTGHGGNKEMKLHRHRNYQATVLKVVNSDLGIELVEESWKKKLLSREFGLNVKSGSVKKLSAAEAIEVASAEPL